MALSADPPKSLLLVRHERCRIPTQEMVRIGGSMLNKYLGVRPAAAERWARHVYVAMIDQWYDKLEKDEAKVAAGVRHFWPTEYVEGCLAEAADTTHLIPLDAHAIPDRLRAFWPAVVRSYWEDTVEKTKSSRQIPTQEAIERLDHVLGWLLWLDRGARQIVWCRAMGISWPKLAKVSGRQERVLRYDYLRSVEDICKRLSKTTKREPPFATDRFRTTHRRG